MVAACRILLLLACIACAGGAFADPEGATTPHVQIGGEVRITEAVDGPLRVLAGDVTVDAPVNGSVKIAGGNVKLGPGAVVSGDVSIAGGNVAVEGTINGRLRAAGGNVRIDGPVAGGASIAAGTLELAPKARIDGPLRFHGGELRRDPAAQVTGGIEHERGGWPRHREKTAVERFMHGWVWSVGLILLAGIIAAAMPGASQRLALELRERPWITALVGLLALITLPIASVLMMITIIGIPIGILALIGYAMLLLLGYVWVAVVVGGMLLDRVKPEMAARTAWHAVAAALAMLALAVLVRVPWVGGFVKLTALAVGVGMIVAVAVRLSRPAGPPTPSMP
ncbi:MAG TPA: polymer-forming cytoskeletal protein [Usitatibacter sp.]|jgi:cytoskeletal protein CcmA (bactofilin family)|nr:polymer-forming cytoskeletal protein [Usitatibacter sp.]